MCPKANVGRGLTHLPHGHVSYATWSILWISLYLAALTDRLMRDQEGKRSDVKSSIRSAAPLEQSSSRIVRRWEVLLYSWVVTEGAAQRDRRIVVGWAMGLVAPCLWQAL
jgi:hypothetical protein